MTPRAIPLQPEDFDTNVVQELIRTKYPDVTVESVSVFDSALSTDGDQRVSTARRITVDVEYGGEASHDLPRRLTIKVARPGLGDIPLYDNEVSVYEHLADELPVMVPRCVGAVRHKSTSSFGLRWRISAFATPNFPTCSHPSTPVASSTSWASWRFCTPATGRRRASTAICPGCSRIRADPFTTSSPMKAACRCW